MAKKGTTPSDFMQFGRVEDQRATDELLGYLRHPLFGSAAPNLKDTGKGKVSLLFPIVRQVVGRDLLHTQSRGTCTSHGWSLLVDYLVCWMVNKERTSKWVAECSHEVIYAGNRIEIGGGRLGRQDGGIGAWCARFVNEFGVLARGKYGNIDLTKPSDDLAAAWGSPGRGVPDELEPLIKQHPARTVSLVQNYEQARDRIANGGTVAVCSNRGFTMTRDKDGFCLPKGSWPHCMLFIAADDEFKRPGLLCQNSWGNYLNGPKRLDQPDGSFWVDADVANSMLSDNDSWTATDLAGYTPEPIEYLMI